jgi:hypothetical protein
LLCTACGFDWDGLDPRLGGGGAGQGGEAGAAGPGGSGTGGTGTGVGGAGGTGGTGGIPCPDIFAAPEETTFGDIAPIAELQGGFSDDDPMVRDDLLELYFNSNRDGDPHQIYRATRDCAADPWPTPMMVSNFDLGMESTTPVLSTDAETMYLAYSATASPQDFDIHRAQRPSPNSANWSTPQPVAELNTTATDRPSWLSPDELTLLMDSQRNGDSDIFVAQRSSTGASWGTPVAVTELNTLADEVGAWSSPDGLTLYFRRTVSGMAGEIYRATRASTGDPWSSIELVAELSTAESEDDPWLSPNGRLMLFSRNVDGVSTLHQALR